MFLFKIILAIPWDSIWIFGWIFYFCIKHHWDFDRDYTESVDHLGYYWHLNNIKSSSSRTWDAFLFIYGSLFMQVSSLHYSLKSSCLGLPTLSALFPQLRESTRICLFLLPVPQTGNSLKAESWALVEFTLCVSHHSGITDIFACIQCLENHCTIYFHSFWLF